MRILISVQNLNSVIYYHIDQPHRAAFAISDVRQALIERTQTTLRHVIGARLLQDVIERREEIATSIREIIEETAASWGVQVESMLIKVCPYHSCPVRLLHSSIVVSKIVTYLHLFIKLTSNQGSGLLARTPRVPFHGCPEQAYG